MIQHAPWLRTVLYILVGAVAGYLYYRFFGCTSGCVITSSPIRTMVYMGVVGGLIGAVTRKETP